MAKIILRVAKGIELTPKIKATLNEILGDNYEVQPYEKLLNLKDSYTERMKSIMASMRLIYNTLPANKGTDLAEIDNYLTWAEQFYNPENLEGGKDINYYQKRLHKYTSLLLELLHNHWKMDVPIKSGLNNAIDLLNTAEQYVILQNGRDDLATLSELDCGDKGKKLFLQFDKKLPSIPKETLAELAAIKKMASDDIKNKRNDKSAPDWFNKLTQFQKSYFLHAASHWNDREALKANISDLIIHLQSLNNETIYTIKNEINKGIFSEQWKKLNSHCKFIIGFLADKPDVNDIEDNLKNLETYVNTMDEQIITNLSENKGPFWFQVLLKYEQIFLKESLKTKDEKSFEELFYSSRKRGTPVVSNLAEHLAALMELDGALIAVFDKMMRASHLGSRLAKFHPVEVGDEHTIRNTEHILGFVKHDQPILIQTLISPCGTDGTIANIANNFIPDPYLDRQLKKEKERLEATGNHNKIIWTNHPLNPASIAFPTDSTSEGGQKLLAHAKTALDNLRSKIKTTPRKDELEALTQTIGSLMELIKEYTELLNASVFSNHTIGYMYSRELHLSVLESLLVIEISGVFFGTCVSGKDREALKIILTDMANVYYITHGKWPRWGDTGADREQFVHLVAQAYTTWHMHKFASQNAPGTDGIKTPRKYLPEDMSAAITALSTPGTLYEDDKKASNNEIGDIKDENGVKMHKAELPDYESCFKASLLFPDRKTIIPLITQMINSTFWEKQHGRTIKSFYSSAPAEPPKGVSAIRNDVAQKDSIEVIADIFAAAKKRLKNPEKTGRSVETKKLYELFETIYKDITTPATQEFTGERIKQELAIILKKTDMYPQINAQVSPITEAYMAKPVVVM